MSAAIDSLNSSRGQTHPKPARADGRWRLLTSERCMAGFTALSVHVPERPSVEPGHVQGGDSIKEGRPSPASAADSTPRDLPAF
ncbi:hypothetical protein VTN00DRAFT_5914 [Thermoascus crustaceus]|uniref:uncharacterized protein n=1 Tax=Thermoascus crustaceus TaxID=5088 RepID=UPI003741FEF2